MTWRIATCTHIYKYGDRAGQPCGHQWPTRQEKPNRCPKCEKRLTTQAERRNAQKQS